MTRWRWNTGTAALVLLALGAGACTAGGDESPQVAPVVVQRPTPAPTLTPDAEPRLDPSGQPVPEPSPPGRPDVTDPSAEIIDVAPVVVEMLTVPEPSPTPTGAATPTPTPLPEPTVEAVDTEPSDEPSDATPTAVPLPTAIGPEGTPIRVAGVVTAKVGPLELFGATCLGAEARIERANRDLEFDRPIEFTGCFDDRGDPDRNRELVDQLTSDGRIFALVPSTSVALFADDLLNERRVPYFGVGDLPAYCGFEQSFGFGQGGALGCPALAATATPVVAVPHLELFALSSGVSVDGLKVALVRSDTIGGELLAASIRLQADLNGAELVLDSNDLPSPAASPRVDWGSLVDEIVDSDAELVIIDGDRTSGLYEALSSRFDGDILGTGYDDPVRFVDDVDLLVALSGSYQISQGFDAVATTSDGWRRYRLDTAAIGIDLADLGRETLSGYVAADLFLSAVAATPAPLTTEALHNIVNNGWQYQGIEGLACAGWWPASHVVAYPCGAVARVDPFGGPLVSVLALTEFDLVVRTPAEAAVDGD